MHTLTKIPPPHPRPHEQAQQLGQTNERTNTRTLTAGSIPCSRSDRPLLALGCMFNGLRLSCERGSSARKVNHAAESGSGYCGGGCGVGVFGFGFTCELHGCVSACYLHHHVRGRAHTIPSTTFPWGRGSRLQEEAGKDNHHTQITSAGNHHKGTRHGITLGWAGTRAHNSRVRVWGGGGGEEREGAWCSRNHTIKSEALWACVCTTPTVWWPSGVRPPPAPPLPPRDMGDDADVDTGTNVGDTVWCENTRRRRYIWKAHARTKGWPRQGLGAQWGRDRWPQQQRACE